jgi:hypothetical protein
MVCFISFCCIPCRRNAAFKLETVAPIALYYIISHFQKKYYEKPFNQVGLSNNNALDLKSGGAQFISQPVRRLS